MNGIKIRPYTPDDYMSFRRNMKEGGLYYPEIYFKQKLYENITRNHRSIIVAKLNGETVGNVLIMEDGWGLFFFRLSVAKDYYNNGIESLFLEKVENILPAKGYLEVYCLVKDSDTQVKDY